jgi:hypothetical protein
MAEKVFIGGFASSEYQVNWIANKMSIAYEEEVEGITFVDASRNPELTASKIHLKSVETHSAGFVATQEVLRRVPEATPLSIQAIAPPNPTPQLVLLNRSRRVGRNLMMDSVKHPESAVSNFLHGAYMLSEVALHSAQHASAIPKIAKFNAVDMASRNNARDIPTELVIMNNDEFFELSYDDILKAKRENVHITYIRGEHGDLICRPAFVLSRIAVAKIVSGCESNAGNAMSHSAQLPA